MEGKVGRFGRESMTVLLYLVFFSEKWSLCPLTALKESSPDLEWERKYLAENKREGRKRWKLRKWCRKDSPSGAHLRYHFLFLFSCFRKILPPIIVEPPFLFFSLHVLPAPVIKWPNFNQLFRQHNTLHRWFFWIIFRLFSGFVTQAVYKCLSCIKLED